MKFIEIANINGFDAKKLDVKDIQGIENMLPSNRSSVIDANVASRGLLITLEGQNLCQEKIAVLDRYLGVLEGKKNKAWADAALVKAKAAGHKTAKDKEWFALADDDFIEISNEISLTKAAKKYLESKSSYFSGWHYSFKSFLNRDFSLEKVAGHNLYGYNNIVGDEDARQNQTTDNSKFFDEEDLWE
jgi:hypothetical protein